MHPSQYTVVAEFRNDTPAEIHLYLEVLCEEVVLAPGHAIQLLARPDPGLLPLAIDMVADGLQVFACRVGDPDWHIRFKGKLIKPAYPTRLAEHE